MSSQKEALERLLPMRGYVGYRPDTDRYYFKDSKKDGLDFIKAQKKLGLKEASDLDPHLAFYSTGHGTALEELRQVLNSKEYKAPVNSVPSKDAEAQKMTNSLHEKIVKNCTFYYNISDFSEPEYFLYDHSEDRYYDPSGIGPGKLYQDIYKRPISSLSEGVYPARIEFVPWQKAGRRVAKDTTTDRDIVEVNSYVPPFWRTHYADVPPKYHGFIKDVLEHLVPDEEHREYVLDWTHHALTSRCQTILILAGPSGIGKSLYVDSILTPLLGPHYCEKGGQPFLEDKFNIQMLHKRLMYLDEVVLDTQETQNRIKNLMNDTIPIEGKGTNPFKILNTASIVLSTNFPDKLGFQEDDRRFSMPVVTEVKTIFNEKLPDTVIAKWNNMLTRPREVAGVSYTNAVRQVMDHEACVRLAEFGNWLLQRKPKNSIMTPLKSDYFFEVVWKGKSTPEWLRQYIIYLYDSASVQPGVGIHVKSFMKNDGDANYLRNLKRNTSYEKIMSVFKDRKFWGKTVYGEVSTSSKDGLSIITPSKEIIDAVRSNPFIIKKVDGRPPGTVNLTQSSFTQKEAPKTKIENSPGLPPEPEDDEDGVDLL